MFGKSLGDDHIAYEQSKLSEEGLMPAPKIEPWMEVAFQESEVVCEANELANKGAQYPLSGANARPN